MKMSCLVEKFSFSLIEVFILILDTTYIGTKNGDPYNHIIIGGSFI